jgi:ribosomal protein S27AE
VATSPQRAYRAACPNCGAPVDFASAASASAVCGFCRSTLVRDGQALQRIGTSAELFDDHSPLQLGASGHYQGVAFTLVGRLQCGTADGTWNEWHALFDGGPQGQRSGWLSEDNGAYVIAFDAPWPGDAPRDESAAAQLAVGRLQFVDGRPWTVASLVRARLIAAQGELPSPPRLQGSFTVVELRSVHDEVGTLDYADPAQPHWSIGRPVTLAELRMTGLAAASEKTLSGRSIECPGCGASLAITLATTQSVACAQCHTVTDLSQGVGGELAHYRQNNLGEGGLQPLIPLGATGTLRLGTPQAVPWQVVGYLERCTLPAPGDDEQAFWREYLLYHREHGFAFLVDSDEDGWSGVRPLTGTPSGQGERVTWRGITYKKVDSYRAKVTWVLGEFYWRVRRGETAQVTDYAGVGKASAERLSREQSADEVVWSAGRTLDAATVAKAFGLSGQAVLKRDAAPLAAAGGGSGLSRATLLLGLFVLLMVALVTCSDGGCDDVRRAFGEASSEYQQCLRTAGGGSTRFGGSWGGYSSGSGGHK